MDGEINLRRGNSNVRIRCSVTSCAFFGACIFGVVVVVLSFVSQGNRWLVSSVHDFFREHPPHIPSCSFLSFPCSAPPPFMPVPNVRWLSLIIRETLRKLVEKHNLTEHSWLIQAYLWRGRDIAELLSERDAEGRGSTQESRDDV